jgi:hypothetical protein
MKFEFKNFLPASRCHRPPHRQELAPAHRSRHQRRPGGRQTPQGTKDLFARCKAGLVFVAAFEKHGLKDEG